MDKTQHWQKQFSEAHLHSWPTASLSIVTPIVKENHDIIFTAAKKFGYEVISKNSSQFCFINPKLKGLKYGHAA